MHAFREVQKVVPERSRSGHCLQDHGHYDDQIDGLAGNECDEKSDDAPSRAQA